MILNNEERLRLLGILPIQGSIATIKILRELREELSFDEEEKAEINLQELPTDKPDEFDFHWDSDRMVDFRIGDERRRIIMDAFRKLDRSETFPDSLLNLYNRFNDG